MVVRDSGRASGEFELNGDGICVWEDEGILERGGGSGCPTLWGYLMPQTRTLKTD